MAPKKKISRRKPGEKSFRNYFDDDTQAAIVRYQQAVIEQPDGTFCLTMLKETRSMSMTSFRLSLH